MTQGPIHPNFKAPKSPRRVMDRDRAILITMSQENWDRIHWALAEGRAQSARAFIADAIAAHLATPAKSETIPAPSNPA